MSGGVKSGELQNRRGIMNLCTKEAKALLAVHVIVLLCGEGVGYRSLVMLAKSIIPGSGAEARPLGTCDCNAMKACLNALTRVPRQHHGCAGVCAQ